MDNSNERDLVINNAIQQCCDIIFSSSSDDSDDDGNEYEYVVHCLESIETKTAIPRLQNYVETIVPQFNDGQFKAHFRMLPSTFEFVLTPIAPKLNRTKPGYKSVSPNKQFLIAIWKMATPDSYRSICEKFDVGRATALRCIRRVIIALEILAPAFITWPSEEKAEEIKNGFFSTSTFPNVLGAIDGTHINIPAPHDHQEAYVNRKGHHSIQLQAVCDNKCRFIHCYAGNVGSVHDQRVFRLSEVKNYLDDPTKFPSNTHLIGDAAYTLHEHLLVPYRDNGHLTQKQKNFNFCHSSARMAIERSFGFLKGRFRSLLSTLDMKCVDLIPKYIIACCVLHNICLLKDDEFPDPHETPPVDDNVQARGELVAINRQGAIKRDNICDQLPLRHI